MTQASIVLEEHFVDPAMADRLGLAGPPGLALSDRAARLAALDAQGIAIEVLSHAPPAVQSLPAPEAADLSRRINDGLASWIAGEGRFAGLASLPMTDPDAAATELERAVTDVGFRGAMVHGLTAGAMPDEARFEPVFAAAEQLDVPIYLHPSMPHPDVAAACYAGFTDRFPMRAMAAAGFTCARRRSSPSA